MASLDNPHFASYKVVSIPGRPDQVAYVWTLKMRSASDTLTVPALATRSGSNDQSSCNVLEPGTGVTANAAAQSSDNVNVVTLAGSTEGTAVIFVSLHTRGVGINAVTPDPS